MIKRATATFTIRNALQGQDLGRQLTIDQKQEAKLKVTSLIPSSKTAHSSKSTRAGFETSREKFSHMFRSDRLKQQKEERELEECLLCHIRSDTTIQREGGLLIKKLACFYSDSIVFFTKHSVFEARHDIARLAQTYKHEAAFKFKEHELTYFEKLFASLVPKAKVRGEMSAVLDYLQNHVCQATSSNQVKPRELEFNFNWDCDEFRASKPENNSVASVQWNFGQLDRADRIHMIYNTLCNLGSRQGSNEVSQCPQGASVREKFPASN